MAAIAVLPPLDYIKDHLPRHRPLISPQMKQPHPNPNPTRSNRRKRSPEKKTSNHNSNKPRNATSYGSPVKNLLVGQVKILKRGEETSPAKNLAGQRKGGDSEMKPKPMKISDFYAGSAIITSPPPSSLPLPAFFPKKNVLAINPNPNFDASADLRRLLRLDLWCEFQHWCFVVMIVDEVGDVWLLQSVPYPLFFKWERSELEKSKLSTFLFSRCFFWGSLTYTCIAFSDTD